METIKINPESENKKSFLTSIKEKLDERKREKVKSQEEVNRFNRVSKPANFVINLIFTLIAGMCIIPFLFVTIISLTSEEYIKVQKKKYG